jgi:hypothetical protein
MGLFHDSDFISALFPFFILCFLDMIETILVQPPYPHSCLLL